jgi:DNA-binding transcriptional MerR regulator
VYTTKDLGILRVIKRLLREERYTVAGAKEYLRSHDLQLEVQEEAMERKAAEELQAPATVHQVPVDLDAVRSAVGELVEIAGSIRQRAAAARQR